MSLFLSPVVIAAWFGGRGVGIFSTLFGALIENLIFTSPQFSFMTERLEMIRVLVYLAQGFGISFIFGEVHQIQKKISIREEQLSEYLERERKNLIEKEQMLEQLNLSQDQIQAERQRAEEANQLKSLFLAHMSHEIRTPLVSVLGFAELLKEPDLNIDSARKYGNIIERTGNNLLEIINDILDLSKVEAGHIDIERIPFSITTLMSDVCSVLKPASEQKSIELICFSDDEMPPLIVSDPSRLRQVLLNLVGNAIKFTEKGFVRIRYHIQGQDLIFTIQDSGIGISTEHKEMLFQSFCQGDRSISRRYAGTGLGLSLSKQLAKRLGGDIFLIESQPGLGSIFQLVIKFEEATFADLASERQKTPISTFDFKIDSNKAVLLVDDSADNQYLIQTLLNRWGLKVTLASNGKEAIEKMKGEKFDLVLMDMQMPIMDGYTACTQLIKDSCQVPIIALTANAMKEDRERCLQAGCKDYITKPIQRNQLLQVLQKNLSL